MGECLCVKIFCVTSIHVSYNTVMMFNASCLSTNHVVAQEPCCYVRTGGCWVWVGGTGGGQERTKEQKLHYREKKETIQAIKLHNQPTPTLAPTWLPYDTRDPRLHKNVAGVWTSVCVCVYLEWYCVQLQQNRTSVGCSQARSEGERKRDTRQRFKGNSRYAQCSSESYLCIFVSP